MSATGEDFKQSIIVWVSHEALTLLPMQKSALRVQRTL